MPPMVDADTLLERYRAVRAFTEKLSEPLYAEDMVIQSMTDASPMRWHLAHTTWFFETFVLREHVKGYETFHPAFEYLFNSYYNAVGAQFPRPRRGMLSRPTVDEVFSYRAYVDDRMAELVLDSGPELHGVLHPIVELGLNHEQQHQELMLTDIKHVLAQNPLFPAYRGATLPAGADPDAPSWVGYEKGLRTIGYGGADFAFDNEGARHEVHLESFELATLLVTNEEYLSFVEEGGYKDPTPWLSEGWATVKNERWKAPLYWVRQGGEWWEFTLAGLQPLDPTRPVCHLSLFEADAFATWAGARLPTEAEWEAVAADVPIQGHFADDELFHPRAAAPDETRPHQMFGDVWEWTQSAYAAYPGYRPAEGAIGEYNGKFMCNQYVLRGGSCATAKDHIRLTYRNFFPAYARWQFTGLRLAR